ncbi:MAG: hypothetical protein P8K79_07875 [Mariniblastus sp.]|nr:hypothetical protein [Mariniblastus sp.]
MTGFSSMVIRRGSIQMGRVPGRRGRLEEKTFDFRPMGIDGTEVVWAESAALINNLN